MKIKTNCKCCGKIVWIHQVYDRFDDVCESCIFGIIEKYKEKYEKRYEKEAIKLIRDAIVKTIKFNENNKI